MSTATAPRMCSATHTHIHTNNLTIRACVKPLRMCKTFAHVYHPYKRKEVHTPATAIRGSCMIHHTAPYLLAPSAYTSTCLFWGCIHMPHNHMLSFTDAHIQDTHSHTRETEKRDISSFFFIVISTQQLLNSHTAAQLPHSCTMWHACFFLILFFCKHMYKPLFPTGSNTTTPQPPHSHLNNIKQGQQCSALCVGQLYSMAYSSTLYTHYNPTTSLQCQLECIVFMLPVQASHLP